MVKKAAEELLEALVKAGYTRVEGQILLSRFLDEEAETYVACLDLTKERDNEERE